MLEKYGVKNLSSLVNTFSGLRTIHNDMIVEFRSSFKLEDITAKVTEIVTSQTGNKMLLPQLKNELEASFVGLNYKRIWIFTIRKIYCEFEKCKCKQRLGEVGKAKWI